MCPRKALQLLIVASGYLAGQVQPGSDSARPLLSAGFQPPIDLAAPPGGQTQGAIPLSLASGDFDGDGVPDLAVGYRSPAGGLTVVYRGNVDAIYPNTPQAKRRNRRTPFLPDPLIVETPSPPQFLMAGDFNGDGHCDLALAGAGDLQILFLPGDGTGRFQDTESVPTPGRITALHAAEVNRPDGLIDLIAAVEAEEVSKLLVYEGPNGALTAAPEVIALPEPATAISVGNLDADLVRDIAVAGGHQLLIVHGRDRRLSSAGAMGEEGSPVRISEKKLPFRIRGLATGDFSGGGQMETAVLSEAGTVHLLSKEDSLVELAPGASFMLPAKISGLPGDDLLGVDSRKRSIRLMRDPIRDSGRNKSLDLPGEIAAVLPMRLNEDAFSDIVVLHSGSAAPAVIRTAGPNLLVTNTASSGAGSLPDAITLANGTTGATILFNIPGTGPFVIGNSGPLVLTANTPVTIDGTTQPGYAGTPIIELIGRIHVLGEIPRSGDCPSTRRASMTSDPMGKPSYWGGSLEAPYNPWLAATSLRVATSVSAPMGRPRDHSAGKASSSPVRITRSAARLPRPET